MNVLASAVLFARAQMHPRSSPVQLFRHTPGFHCERFAPAVPLARTQHRWKVRSVVSRYPLTK